MTTVFASTAADWRAWLARNCHSEKEAWLVIHHKGSATPSVRIHEAVEQALCYGWIDSLHRKRDANSSQLRFTPRTRRSKWSAANRRRAARMIELGLMTEHGQAMIDQAKADNRWEVVPEAPRDAVPKDRRELFDRNEVACAAEHHRQSSSL